MMRPLTADAGQHMKPSPNLIGLGSGLVTAVLIASLANVSLLGLVLSCFVPLPMFLAGIGWGVWAGTVSLATTTVMLAFLNDIESVFRYVIFAGSPILVLIYMLHLHRVYEVIPTSNADGDDGARLRIEWYPFGSIIAWATVMAGGLATFILLMISGGDAEHYVQVIGEIFGDDSLAKLQPLFGSDVTLEQTREFMAYMMPKVVAQMWLTLMVANLWIAAKSASISNLLIRPFPAIGSIEYPPFLAAGFFAALVVGFAPGIVGLLGSAFTGALELAFILLGLTVLHALLSDSSYRIPALCAVYAGLFLPILSFFVALSLLGLGLAEPFLHLRQRFRPPKLPSGTSSGQD